MTDLIEQAALVMGCTIAETIRRAVDFQGFSNPDEVAAQNYHRYCQKRELPFYIRRYCERVIRAHS